MANVLTALGSAVYSRLSGQGTVAVYQNLAEQGAQPPYCVFQVQTGTDDYVFGPGAGTVGIVDAIYAVRVVSNRYWTGEAQIIYDGNIHPALQGAPLSVSGHTVLRCLRVSLIPPYQDNDKYWHVGGLYRIEVQPT